MPDPGRAARASSPAGESAFPPALGWVLAVALVIAHFASFDIVRRPVTTDIRYTVYFASQIAHGAVPHRDYFENRPPLAAATGALFARLGETLSIDPLLAMRAGFLAIAGLIGLLLFAIHRALAEGDDLAGLIGLLAYLGLPLLGLMPAIGPFPKPLMALAIAGSALLAHRERWVLAGACAALAALDWQIGIVAPLGVLAAALVGPQRRWHATARVVLGGAIVALVTVSLLAVFGAFDAALRQLVLASAARGEATLKAGSFAQRLVRVAHLVHAGCREDTWIAASGVLGALLFPFAVARRRSAAVTRLAVVVGIPFYGVIGFSLLDFQRFGDLYILLVALAFFAGVALWFAWSAAALAATHFGLLASRRGRIALATVALVATALAVRPGVLRPLIPMTRVRGARDPLATLADQRAVADEIRARYVGRPIAVIGPSEQLFLAGRRSDLPFVFWNNATYSIYRSSPDEDADQTLRRLIDEYRIEVIGHDPGQSLAPILDRDFTLHHLVAPSGHFRLDVWERQPQAR